MRNFIDRKFNEIGGRRRCRGHARRDLCESDCSLQNTSHLLGAGTYHTMGTFLNIRNSCTFCNWVFLALSVVGHVVDCVWWRAIYSNETVAPFIRVLSIRKRQPLVPDYRFIITCPGEWSTSRYVTAMLFKRRHRFGCGRPPSTNNGLLSARFVCASFALWSLNPCVRVTCVRAVNWDRNRNNVNNEKWVKTLLIHKYRLLIRNRYLSLSLSQSHVLLLKLLFFRNDFDKYKVRWMKEEKTSLEML